MSYVRTTLHASSAPCRQVTSSTPYILCRNHVTCHGYVRSVGNYCTTCVRAPPSRHQSGQPAHFYLELPDSNQHSRGASGRWHAADAFIQILSKLMLFDHGVKIRYYDHISSRRLLVRVEWHGGSLRGRRSAWLEQRTTRVWSIGHSHCRRRKIHVRHKMRHARG